MTELVAIEPERNMRPRAEEAATTAPVPVRVVAAFGEDLPFQDASIDAAVASLVLCSVPDPAGALAELSRVVRPGGELRFYEHVYAQRQPLRAFLGLAYTSGIWPRMAGGCNPTRDTERAIEAAGFTIERCELFAFSPSLLSPKLPFRLGVARRRT